MNKDLVRTFSVLLYFVLFAGPAVAQAPTISSFSPTSGATGAVVTITGSGMAATPSDNIVFFGATKAIVQSATASQLTVLCPAGATFKPITVTVNGLTAFSAHAFLPTSENASQTDDEFATPESIAHGGNPQYVQISDMDLDGKSDLIVVNTDGKQISVLRNISSVNSLKAESFSPRVDFAVDHLPWSTAVGDLDGDGKPDLVVAGGGSNAVSIFRNLASPDSFTSGSLAPRIDLGTGIGANSVIIDDLDSDGKPDLATANYANNTISVFKNTSTASAISFQSPVSFAAPNFPAEIVAGDLNSDGKKDLAICSQNTNVISVYRNTSTAGVIATNSFDAKVDFVTGNLSTSYPCNIAIGDLDGDGKLDLAINNSNGAGLTILKGTGNAGPITSSSFNEKVDFQLNAGGRGLHMGDLNGDGKPDILMTNYQTDDVSVYKNTTTSNIINATSFTLATELTLEHNVRSLAIGDLNGDNVPDIAATHAVTPNSKIWLIRNKNGLITGIDETDPSIDVFPSRVKDTFTITGSRAECVMLAIADTNGKWMIPNYHRAAGNQFEVDVRSLAPGLYFLRIAGSLKTFRLVKE